MLRWIAAQSGSAPGLDPKRIISLLVSFAAFSHSRSQGRSFACAGGSAACASSRAGAASRGSSCASAGEASARSTRRVRTIHMANLDQSHAVRAAWAPLTAMAMVCRKTPGKGSRQGAACAGTGERPLCFQNAFREGRMGRKIVIVGAGAVGGYAGAHMIQAGEDVTFIDPWPAHVEHMQKQGLRITHAKDVPEFRVPVRALHVTDAQQLAKEKPIDIAFICMKSYDTAWATMLIRQYLAPDGYVVSLQNCMNEETIAGIVGWGKTVGCIASSITVNLPEPGLVHRGAAKHRDAHIVFRAGEPHGRITRRAEEVCRLVGYADSAKVTNNLWGERWSKLVTNAMQNGISACTGLGGGDMLK